MGVVLNYGQIPLIKSRYMKYINNEEQPYGENVIVAICIFSGYNVEDSILFNEGSVKRGMFRTTYYSSYETKEESSKVANSKIDTRFMNIEENNVNALKPGYDYSGLDKYGLILENTSLDDKKVIIGKAMVNPQEINKYIDASEFLKKGQLGYVDKSFITEGEEGFRIAKVRVREERKPEIGDKFCSRCGQKGTVGLIIPEQDMPFTMDGIKPDIIINPHALPSRMTIGQLIETLMGKACAMYGGFGDCTAFVNKGSTNELFGSLLNNIGFNSTGNQILYNGQTGEQLSSNIFIGPTYYMRLKHMVKDKINYRALGPRTALTRQTVQGRANDGGLRIGEMERDGIIAHGASKFIEESLMVRGDQYYMAVCNQSGTIAVYNESQNLFLSPMIDGPIKFSNITEFNANISNISKYGREFSIVRIPYAFKLLMQELLTMNIQMRIITENNVDQLTNMTFSDNHNKLTGNYEISLKEIINKAIDKQKNIKRPINKKNTKEETKNELELIQDNEEWLNITKVDPKYKLFAFVPSSYYSVLKPWQETQVRSVLLKWFPSSSSISSIVDATSHIGVDTINLSDTFPSAIIQAYEIVPNTFKALVTNIKTFHKEKLIFPHLIDITKWKPTTHVDFLYVDPPWGGEDYALKQNINLYLQKEGDAPDESKNINNLIEFWLSSHLISFIILKAPKNFNKEFILNKYNIEEKIIKNRAGKIAYYLILIKEKEILQPKLSNILENEVKEKSSQINTEQNEEVNIPITILPNEEITEIQSNEMYPIVNPTTNISSVINQIKSSNSKSILDVEEEGVEESKGTEKEESKKIINL
jgi:hypothetical protein